MRPRALLAVGIGVGIAFLACSAERKGQLVIAVTTDMRPGEDFNRVEIEIVAGNDRRTEKLGDLGGTTKLPFTISIVEGTAPAPEVHVRIATGLATPASSTFLGDVRTVHELTANVPSDRIALARMHLDWLCTGAAELRGGAPASTCPTGQTCSAGSCIDWGHDTSTLPTYVEEDVFGGTAAASAAGECFDTVRCFAAGEMADVDLATCSIARAAGDAVNVALVPGPDEKGGICGTEACFFPLDEGERFGFRFAGTRIQLPFEACRRLAGTSSSRKRLLGVARTTACPTKTVRMPTCGPWSSARGGSYTDQAPSPIGYRDASVDSSADATASPDAGQ